MKPAEFAYHRPESVAEALFLLAELPDAKLLAGGQSLLTLMNLRLARPAAVIDIGGLVELTRIFDDTDDLVLGAMVTHRTVETDPLIAARTPLLADAARYIGHIGIRNRGTIGGSLAHADPAAEMPLAALALGPPVTWSRPPGAPGGGRPGPVPVVLHQLPGTRRNAHLDFPACDHAAAGLGIRRIRPSARRLRNGRSRGDADPGRSGTCRGGAGGGAQRCGPAAAVHRRCGEYPSAGLWEQLAADWAAQTEPSADDAAYARRLCAVALEEALTAAAGRLAAEQEVLR